MKQRLCGDLSAAFRSTQLCWSMNVLRRDCFVPRNDGRGGFLKPRIHINKLCRKLGDVLVYIIADLFQVAAFQLGEDLHQQQVIYFVAGIS